MDQSSTRRSFFKWSFTALGLLGLGGALTSASKFFKGGSVSSTVHASVPGAFHHSGSTGSGSGGGLLASKAPDGLYEISSDSIPMDAGAIVSAGVTPVIVVHNAAGFRVFNATCSHLGCLVKWDNAQNMFLCPCHGGKYDANGKVLAGPPPYALREHGVEEKDDLIRIALA